MDQLFSNKSKISPFSLKIPHKILLFDKGCLNSVQTVFFFEIFYFFKCSDSYTRTILTNVLYGCCNVEKL